MHGAFLNWSEEHATLETFYSQHYPFAYFLFFYYDFISVNFSMILLTTNSDTLSLFCVFFYRNEMSLPLRTLTIIHIELAQDNSHNVMWASALDVKM